MRCSHWLTEIQHAVVLHALQLSHHLLDSVKNGQRHLHVRSADDQHPRRRVAFPYIILRLAEKKEAICFLTYLCPIGQYHQDT